MSLYAGLTVSATSYICFHKHYLLKQITTSICGRGLILTKCPGGWVVSSPNLGSHYFGLRWISPHDCMALHCTGPFIIILPSSQYTAGLGGSVGCAVRLETRRSQVQPPPRSATFFHWDWSWNIFYSHSLPFRFFKKGGCHFLAKKCAQYWLTA